MDLIYYIRTRLQQGIPISVIKEELISQGYSPKVIEKAFRRLYEVKHVIHLSKTTIAMIVALISSFFLLGFALFIYLSAPSKLLDINVNIIDPEIKQGEKLGFDVVLYNFGKTRYDIKLRYNVLDETNSLISFKEEMIAIETRTVVRASMSLPNLDAGNYILEVVAIYGDKIARVRQSFRIYKDSIKNQTMVICDDNDPCTQDIFDGKRCIYNKIEPCCGNGKCELNENETCPQDCKIETEEVQPTQETQEKKSISIEKIKEGETLCTKLDALAQARCFTQLAKATKRLAYCNKIIIERRKWLCYEKIADLLDKKAICKSITIDAIRDSCYMNFVMKGDYSVCNLVTDEYLRKSCELLRGLT